MSFMMKKQFFTLLLSASLFTTNPLFAMEDRDELCNESSVLQRQARQLPLIYDPQKSLEATISDFYNLFSENKEYKVSFDFIAWATKKPGTGLMSTLKKMGVSYIDRRAHYFSLKERHIRLAYSINDLSDSNPFDYTLLTPNVFVTFKPKQNFSFTAKIHHVTNEIRTKGIIIAEEKWENKKPSEFFPYIDEQIALYFHEEATCHSVINLSIDANQM